MRTVRPRNPVDLPLSGRDCEADGAAYFTVAPVRRDPTDPKRCCWLLCDEADAEMLGLYAAASGPSVWISDHPTRAAAERASRCAAGAGGMSGRCDTCGAPAAGLYEMALIRIDDGLMDADAVACARMAEMCPACRDRLVARLTRMMPVWERGANRHDAVTDIAIADDEVPTGTRARGVR